MEFLINLVLLIALGTIGLVFGSLNEQRHYRSLREREARYRHVLVFNEKRPPLQVSGQPFHLVQGSVVVSSDYFKNMAARLRSIFGGNLKSYETLIDRARREALVRMKAQADSLGAHLVMGVRFETSTLNQSARGQIVSCEVLAYGTAFVVPERNKQT